MWLAESNRCKLHRKPHCKKSIKVSKPSSAHVTYHKKVNIK
nr:MAG TPA: hypothetical protein [Caudoviricetes sp.]